MIFEDLITQLHDVDPQKRVEALRVLAMVEETRAVNEILSVYQQDADSQVREVAKWAGSLIWRAGQNGHDTLAAMQAHFQGTRQDYVANTLLDGLALMTPPKDKAEHEQAMMRMTREHSEALTKQHGAPAYQVPAVKTDTQIMAGLSSSVDDLDLLDAGLRDL